MSVNGILMYLWDYSREFPMFHWIDGEEGRAVINITHVHFLFNLKNIMLVPFEDYACLQVTFRRIFSVSVEYVS